jgi:hypothetical protein
MCLGLGIGVDEGNSTEGLGYIRVQRGSVPIIGFGVYGVRRGGQDKEISPLGDLVLVCSA